MVLRWRWASCVSSVSTPVSPLTRRLTDRDKARIVVCYDDDGILTESSERPTKAMIRERTNWILEALPTINPSRTILNRVNQFIISDGCT